MMTDIVPVPSLASWQPRDLDPALTTYEPHTFEVPADAAYLTRSGAVRISGSEHCLYILERLTALFKTFHPNVEFSLELLGTRSAVPFLIHGRSLFSVMGRAMTRPEKVPYTKATGALPVEIRIAHAAEDVSQHLATSLAVYVHKSNPLAQLTMQQLSRIFTIGNPGGDYSRWGQLGLSGEWASRLIHPLGTPEYSGFGSFMQEQIFSNRPVSPFYEHYTGTKQLLPRLAADPAAITVAALGCQHDDIRAIAIADENGSAPTTGTTAEVAGNRYPLGRFVYFYLRQEAGAALDPLSREFMRLVLSRESQAIIAAQPLGYIPLSEAEAMIERQKLGAIATKFNDHKHEVA